MSEVQKNFVKGAVLLAIAGLTAKIIGAFFRIPLVNVIGTEGIGYYSMAYPVYSLIGVVATAGIPAAISKMVAEQVATGNRQKSHDIFKIALKALIILGIVCSVLLFVLSPFIAEIMKSMPAVYSLWAISPAVFFAAIISAYRGYFQGLEHMKPTAFSQLIEQFFKLLLGLSLAYVFYAYTKKAELGACGALIGICLSEIISCIYIKLAYKKYTKIEISKKAIEKVDKTKSKAILKTLIKLAIPVVIGACMMPIILSIDSLIVSRMLQNIGYAQREAAALYGVLTGVVNPLINMPAVLSLALAMSLVPSISASFIKKDEITLKSKTSLGLKLAITVGLPAAAGFFLLAQPIIMLLYKSVVGQELTIAVTLLQTLSLGVLCLSFAQTATGILQGLNKPLLPVYSLAAGIIVKIAVSIALISIPSLNILGAAIGTLLCFLTVAIVNMVFLIKYSNVKISLGDHIVKPVCATISMCVVAGLVYSVLGFFSNTVGVIAAILVAFFVYVIVILCAHTLNEEEILSLPGGTKLMAWLVKMKVY